MAQSWCYIACQGSTVHPSEDTRTTFCPSAVSQHRAGRMGLLTTLAPPVSTQRSVVGSTVANLLACRPDCCDMSISRSSPLEAKMASLCGCRLTPASSSRCSACVSCWGFSTGHDTCTVVRYQRHVLGASERVHCVLCTCVRHACRRKTSHLQSKIFPASRALDRSQHSSTWNIHRDKKVGIWAICR